MDSSDLQDGGAPEAAEVETAQEREGDDREKEETSVPEGAPEANDTKRSEEQQQQPDVDREQGEGQGDDRPRSGDGPAAQEQQGEEQRDEVAQEGEKQQTDSATKEVSQCKPTSSIIKSRFQYVGFAK